MKKEKLIKNKLTENQPLPTKPSEEKLNRGLNCLPCGRPLPENKPFNSLDLDHWQKQLQIYLTQKGLKHSDQRIKIIKQILEFGSHFNTTELAKIVQKDHPDIGSATVYRTVALLVEAKMLHESLVNENGQSFYEVGDETHHDHIVCLDCHHIFEFQDKEIEQLQESLAQKMKFEQQHHRHVLYSHCKFKKANEFGR